MPTVRAGRHSSPLIEEIGEAAIVVEQDADLPGAGLAEIDRGEGVDGDQRRLAVQQPCGASRQASIASWIGRVDVGETSRPLFLAQLAIGRHRAPFAFGDDKACSHRPRRLQSMMRREASGQKSGASSFADRSRATASAPGSQAMCSLQRILGKSKRLIGFRDAI